jgi:hypothetical protein
VAPKLSHYNVVTNEEERQSFDNKERIHKILARPSVKALYFSFVEDVAKILYFPDFHEI